MTSEFPVTGQHVAATEPGAVLGAIMARVGADGLAAAVRIPGLLAAVDQHAAAIRESLAANGLTVTAVPLAGYGSSVVAAASRMGRQLPDPESVDWSRANWFQLRLTAVCALARTLDCA
ncbi:DUF6401 family natural product biosynthesis protein [Planosporangium sp. 12N6]|uniref:DUF6401 family natural product biosynthesis protein n=1 Tax=Planosporangium spinosum TaxID=3402278 RepID=UPI003CFA4783